jgi:hypothetical protein
MGRPEFDPAAADEPLYSMPDAGTDSSMHLAISLSALPKVSSVVR